MGQAGAQREPSMEEILASIRRIIENNEPGQDGNPIDAAEAFSHHDDAEDAYAADQEADSLRTAANDAPVAQPVSLADVAARARAVPDTFRAVETMIDTPQDTPDPVLEVDDAAAEELREALTSEEPVEAVAEVAVETAGAVVESDEPEHDEPVARQQDAGASANPAAHQESPADHQSGGQLVSLHTGEKVAASFGELDAAIAAGQQRTFDEIAEEMLRPMLTQWLDDNLPTLVERLVREEIERVSRGNRR